MRESSQLLQGNRAVKHSPRRKSHGKRFLTMSHSGYQTFSEVNTYQTTSRGRPGATTGASSDTHPLNTTTSCDCHPRVLKTISATAADPLTGAYSVVRLRLPFSLSEREIPEASLEAELSLVRKDRSGLDKKPVKGRFEGCYGVLERRTVSEERLIDHVSVY